jgi:hypothetical protein
MEEVGGLIVDLIRSAARAKAAREQGEAAPTPGQVLRRYLVGEPQTMQPPAPRAAPGPPIKVKLGPAQPAPAAPVFAVAPAPKAGSPLLADFHDGRRFLAAFVLAEALGPPVGLRRREP